MYLRRLPLHSVSKCLTRGFKTPGATGATKYRRNVGKNDRTRQNRRDEDQLISRTHHRAFKDDGLRGEKNYEIDRDALNSLKWTDLIPEDAREVEGMSPVPTGVLATRRLLNLPLVNSLIYNRRYEWLTPVQAQTLLPILKGESVVVRAKTGTGKTAAFAIPTLQKVLEAGPQGRGKVKAVIISPTRELAQQIADEIFKMTQYGGMNFIKVQALVGGLSKERQLRQAGLLGKGGGPVADIIVATPGRLNDVLEDEKVLERFSNIVFRVFDEADRLLDIGFERILAQIRDKLESVTGDREVPMLLFSATADRTVRNFAQDQFGDRVRIVNTIPRDEPTANELVDQHATLCPSWREVYEGAAAAIIKAHEDSKLPDARPFKAIVFLPTVAMVENFTYLLRALLPASIRKYTSALHGKVSQSSRQHRADKFRRDPEGILVTTDVVARGMDFPFVTHVFQLGVPPDVASYVHRIGRTARIGNRGESQLFLTGHMRQYLGSLKREGIKPQVHPYDPISNEFREEFQKVARRLTDEEFKEMVNSLLAYMAVLKSQFNIYPSDFMRGMKVFAEMFGHDHLPLTQANKVTWSSAPRRQDGSSRRTRFRFY